MEALGYAMIFIYTFGDKPIGLFDTQNKDGICIEYSFENGIDKMIILKQ